MRKFYLRLYFPIVTVLGLLLLVSLTLNWNNVPSELLERDDGPASVQYSDSLNSHYYYPKSLNDVARERFEYLRKYGSFKLLGNESQPVNLKKTIVNEWENIGPYGISACPVQGGRNDEDYSGRIISLGQDYGDADIMYLGAASGGLWKSTDRGNSWTNIFDNLAHPSVGTIATNIKKPGEVWIGTGNKGNGFSGGPAAPSLGLVYYSDDFGANWNLVNFSPNLVSYVSKILVRPGANSNIPDVVFIATDNGVFRSEDRTNWTKVLSGVYSDIVQVGDVFSPDYKVITARNDIDSIYQSSEKGLPGTWVNKVLPGSGFSYGRVTLTSSPTGLHTKVYANVATDTGSLLGIWRSNNGGDTWASVTSPYVGGQMNYNNTILVDDELNGLIVYTGTNSRELFKSTDGGLNWSTSYNNPLGRIHEDQHFILDDVSHSGQIFVANDGGLYKSTDRGSNFTYIGNSSLSIAQIYNLTVNPESGGLYDGTRYYIGTQDNGIQRGPNEFLVWQALTCCDGIDIAFKSGIYYTTIVGLSATSTKRVQYPPDINPCQTWLQFTTGLPNGSPSFRSQLIYNGTHFYLVFGGGVWRATSGVLPWMQLQNFGGVTRMGVTPENIVVVGINNAIPVRVSDAANTTFNTPVNPATFWGGQFVTDIDFGKLLGGKRDIYVTLSSTSGTRIVRSTDNGVNFFDVTGNLPNLVNVRCILVDPTNDNDWYVGSDLGVWVSYDGGTNWIPFSNQLPAASYVMDLEFDPYSSKIVAGTYGRGVFISDRFVLSVDDERSLPSEFVLSNNYPNPFNPKTTIKYSVPNLSFVTIKVFDVLGKEVASLVNDEKSVGSYEVEFNAGNLSSGIYLYRLQAGSFVETKKMVLMK